MAFGATPLFENLSIGVYGGDHVGVVGPNGSGKTTLLRLLAGLETPTGGVRSVRKQLRFAFVAQDPTFGSDATVRSVLERGVARPGLEPHEAEARLAMEMSKAGFGDGDQPAAALSGGWMKRLAIAAELAREPELLLLDEPTNHLDVEGILWLEERMRRDPEAFVAVSHDRYFLESVATRMVEINRAFATGFLDVRGGYRHYLEKKDEGLTGQASEQESLRNRVRGELDWLSRKARARTRKAKARIDEAGRLGDKLADLDDRARTAAVGVDFAGTDRRTKRLLVAEDIGKSYGDRAIVRGVDLVLSPGTRLGLLGPNGSGKTTLLRMLEGAETPDTGHITRADAVRTVMFDQHRSRLDAAMSLRRSLAPEGDQVIYQDKPIHVAGWAKRFLFRPEQLETPVGQLSGGEQARVVLARLMLEPADLLLLDEPTNDLDIPTLETLEESLLSFPGALVLVTHDRHLLDRVSTSLLCLDGKGGVEAFADYPQWEAERARPAEKEPSPAPERPRARSAEGKKRLTYLEQREWEQMESSILAAEERLQACRAAAEDPAIAADHEALVARHAARDEAQAAVDALYARWADLEEKVAD